MLVGIEMSAALMSRCSGVGNYIANLVAGLRKLEADSTLELLYFSNRADFEGTGARLSGIDSAQLYSRDSLPLRGAWMQLGLPRSLARTRPDICHFPNYLAPVLTQLETPFVATMYDMSIYRFPQYHPLKTVLVHQAIMPTVARRTRQLITASESARQDILHYLKVSPQQVRVIPGGLNPAFMKKHTPAEEAALRQRYHLPFPYILMVGTLEPRKNHRRLVQAYNQLIQQEGLPHHLVLVGAAGWKEAPLLTEISQSGLTERIHWLGYVPTADMPGLYQAASAFVFPSLHEGFGLPLLEALASGTPTLISNDPALVEVAGPQVALVTDPYSVATMASDLYTLLTDKPLAARLSAAGIERAQQFSWDKCADQTLQVYEEARQPYLHSARITAAADSAPVSSAQLTDEIIYFEPKAANIDINSDAISNIDTPELESPSVLEQAIYETIVYANIFSFPLTLVELQRYLIGQAATLSQVQACLVSSVYLQKHLEMGRGYIYLSQQAAIAERRQQSILSTQHQWEAALFWGKWLSRVPFLRAALVTGGLAAENAGLHDDIDFLLITEPGHLWSCRAMIIGLVHLARWRGVEICPNYLLANTEQALTLTTHNLYTAREFANMRLVFGKSSYKQLVSLNDWVGEFLPNALTYVRGQQSLLPNDQSGRLGRWVKRFGEKLLGGKLGNKFEQWEQRRKIARFSRPTAVETCFTSDVCKGHYTNYGQEILAAFARRSVLELEVTPAPGREKTTVKS
jgi:glycosyltransferase involved in cell wall biosynthesis